MATTAERAQRTAEERYEALHTPEGWAARASAVYARLQPRSEVLAFALGVGGGCGCNTPEEIGYARALQSDGLAVYNVRTRTITLTSFGTDVLALVP